MSFKACFKCLQRKPLEAFYRHPRMADGRLNKCAECTKTDVRENRLAKPEQYSAYERARGVETERRESSARSRQKWAASNTERRRAQLAVGNAVRDGRLTPQPCFVCGAPAHAHHPDYSAPLAVSWLCPRHHALVHREHREWLRQAA